MIQTKPHLYRTSGCQKSINTSPYNPTVGSCQRDAHATAPGFISQGHEASREAQDLEKTLQGKHLYKNVKKLTKMETKRLLHGIISTCINNVAKYYQLTRQ